MENVLKIVFAGLATLAGLLGLFLAARAADQGIYLFGMLLFAFALVIDFGMLKSHFDAQER